MLPSLDDRLLRLGIGKYGVAGDGIPAYLVSSECSRWWSGLVENLLPVLPFLILPSPPELSIYEAQAGFRYPNPTYLGIKGKDRPPMGSMEQGEGVSSLLYLVRYPSNSKTSGAMQEKSYNNFAVSSVTVVSKPLRVWSIQCA